MVFSGSLQLSWSFAHWCIMVFVCIFSVCCLIQTTTAVLWPTGLCPGLPGWAGTKKLKQIWFYWSKR